MFGFVVMEVAPRETGLTLGNSLDLGLPTLCFYIKEKRNLARGKSRERKVESSLE